MEETTTDLRAQLAMARLPSLPQALLQILDLAERDDVGVAELAAVVAQDVGLAAKVVATANSAYYSRGRAIASIEQCLSVMGAAQVRRIAMNQSVAELFGRFQKSGGFDMRVYWRHVLCVAFAARDLAQRLNYPNVDEAYLAGLLHDVGQLALLTVDADRYFPLFKHATGESSLLELERERFELTHADAGAWLAERWGLHSFFADAVLYHHEPLPRVRDAHLLAQIIALADRFCSHDADAAMPDANTLAIWQLTESEAKNLSAKALKEAEQAAEALGIEITVPQPSTPASPFAPESNSPALARLADAVSVRMEAVSTLPAGQEAGPSAETPAEPVQHAPYLALLRSAKMLFSTRSACLFIRQDADSAASATPFLQGLHTAEDDPRLAEIRIQLTATPAPDSAIARALQGKVQLAGEQPQAESLADAQVRRILGQARLLCIPLVHGGVPLGVLVIGMESASAAAYLQRHALLSTFAREGGRRLAEALQAAEVAAHARAEATEAFQLHARKIVHEANNPLGVVRNYIALLREQLADKQQVQSDIDLVESELRRVARILQDMKQPISPTPARATGVAVNTLIDEVVRFCRLGRPELANVDIRLNLATPLPQARIPADKLKQALTNLLFNAAEAMPQGGRIEITSQAISTSAWPAGGTPGAQGSNAIELTVADNGPGIPPEVLARQFQPVQTHKGGEHQGLGLSIINKLVTEMGGMLQCQSGAEGTRFKILLPVFATTA